jgi:hypothetical protein
MTDLNNFSSPIDINFQLKLFKISSFYTHLIEKIKSYSTVQNLYTTSNGYTIKPSDRYNAIVGRRCNNLCQWVNKIEHSPDRAEALIEYSAKHIAWAILDELRNHTELITEFRTFIMNTVDESYMKRIDHIISKN